MPTDTIELPIRPSRIPYFDLINKKHERLKIKKKLMQFNRFLQTFGLCFKNIQITKDNQSNNFKLGIENNTDIDDEHEENSKLNAIFQNARDKACMSDRSYKTFRKSISPAAKIVSLERCNSYKTKIDNFWMIETNDKGSFIAEPLSKIKYVCSKYIDNLVEPKTVKNNTFNILISGDGFMLTKTQTSALNCTFSLLNDGDLSHNGFYILGIFSIDKEDYDNVKTSLKELINKLKEIKHVTIKNITYNVNFQLGGDLKWLATVLGVGAGNSDFPCPWCTWKSESKKDIWTETEINSIWPIDGRDHQTAACLSKEKTSSKRKGYLREPIFPFIEFSNTVVDPLHLMLRISDKLFELLLLRLKKLDSEQPTFKIRDFSTCYLTLSFLDYLKDEKTGCNLTSPYYAAEGGFKLRTLNENERMRIFEKLFYCNSLLNIFPSKFQNDSTLININDVFKGFYEIIKLLKNDYNIEIFNKCELELKIKDWLRKLIQVDNNITPYTHILCFHVPEFIEKFRNLNLFSMQGLEKLNHITKLNYFKSTNHRKNFTSTLIKKMNRMELIHLKGNLSEIEKKAT